MVSVSVYVDKRSQYNGHFIVIYNILRYTTAKIPIYIIPLILHITQQTANH